MGSGAAFHLPFDPRGAPRTRKAPLMPGVQPVVRGASWVPRALSGCPQTAAEGHSFAQGEQSQWRERRREATKVRKEEKEQKGLKKERETK